MAKKIFKSINPSFIIPYFHKKKGSFFPDKKDQKIDKIEIGQVSPVWAKDTCLARYKINFTDGSQKIVRGTSKNESSKIGVWHIMNYLYSQTSNQKKISVPKPLDYLKEIGLLLYEEAPGNPLVSVLQKESQKKKEESLKKAATWLSWLHSLNSKEKIPKALFIKSDGYKKILFKIERNIPELKKHLFPKKYVDFVDTIWMREKKIIHNDFYPGNSIVGEKVFFGIDFDRAGTGPPLMDVAALFSFFDFSKKMWPYKMRKEENEKLKKVFLKEYCLINNISFDKTLINLHPFLVKSFLDQLQYYTNFFMKGRRFMDKKTKDSFSLIIKELLIKIKKMNK